jgi:predicted HicB family RNase H-like nuclease
MNKNSQSTATNQSVTTTSKPRYSFPLRLPLTVRRRANDVAHSEGLSLNHFISIAVAERISRTEHAVQQRDRSKLPLRRQIV